MEMSSTTTLESVQADSMKKTNRKLKRCLGIVGLMAIALVVAVIVLAVLYADNESDTTSPSVDRNIRTKPTDVPTTSTQPAICSARPTVGTPPKPPANATKAYTQAMVAADDGRCSEVGRNTLRANGSAVDAAIATLFCVGVINMHSTGIGGGAVMVVYSAKNKTAQYFNSRESAPASATQNMFVNKSSAATSGGLAIAVPGEVKGMYEAWKRYGRLEWKELVEPSIEIAREGFIVHAALAKAIEVRKNSIMNDPGLREILVEDGCIKRKGDRVVNQKLAITLERIANDPMTFYEGQLAKDIAHDIASRHGIVTAQDLKDYTVQIEPAIKASTNNYNLYTSGLPSSGILIAFMLNVLKGYNFTSTDVADDKKAKTYHRIIETFKYAYARRALLGDKYYTNITQIYDDLLDEAYANEIRKNISDTKTFNDPEHYGGYYANRDIPGTSHVSVLAPNGDAVSVTSTINTYFGSKVRSTITGITYNNEMDDFSTPGLINAYGVEPSPSNFIRPGKRPMSSMSPVIFANKTSGTVVFIAGASGGTRITTGTALTAMNKLWFGYNTSAAVEAPRFHDQLLPNYTAIEKQPYKLPSNIVTALQNLGHKVEEKSFYSVVQAISKESNGEIYGKSDARKGGYPAGF